MAEFLIAPPEPVDWTLDVDGFGRAVTARWPTARVRRWPEEAPLAASAWVAGRDPWDDLLLELHRNGCVLGVDVRSKPVAAEVACWWRRLLPAEPAALWLFDRSFRAHSEVRPESVPADLFAE